MTKEQWSDLLKSWIGAAPFEDIGDKNIRAILSGLTRECPFGGNPGSCCMHEIRKMPPAERETWVKGLSPAQVETIYNHHLICSRCMPES
jgi:hypothetical protein